MAEGRGNVIKLKLGTALAEARARATEGQTGPDKAWRLALARSARDRVKLALDVRKSSLDRMTLAEILELSPERGLISVLEGPRQALGVLMLGPEVLAGMIEAQTTGIVTTGPAPERRPTRTDAAMVAAMIDGALEELERGLTGQEDGDWAMGYRYASFLEDIRPLGLLLEDIPYRVLRAEVNLAYGAKKGMVFMALPAEVRLADAAPADALRNAAEALLFSQGFCEHVLCSPSQLDGVLARISLSLAQVMGFELGQVLPLGGAASDRISVEGMDGRKLWEGKLGQNRGLLAVRLTDEIGGVAAPPQPKPAPVEATVEPSLAMRAAG